LSLTLEKEETTGSVTVDSNPSGANIYLNGSYKGTTPKTIEDLEAGSYSLKLTKEGYEEKTERVQIEKGKTKEVEIKLTEKQETVTTPEFEDSGTGYLKIEGNTGRTYYIDGEKKGWIIPKEVKLKVGKHTVEIEGKGETEIEISENETTIIDNKTEFKSTSPYIEKKYEDKYKPSAKAPEQVLVKAGIFQMGNTRRDGVGNSDEKPVHIVKLTYDYYIGKYEVTFNEYDAYCEATGESKRNVEGWGRGDRPVISVSWYDAKEYCNWLSEQEGLSKAYDSEGKLLDKNGKQTTDITQVEGYRLPTEAEWEYAARGGHKSSEDYEYSGSNRILTNVWFKDNSNHKTHEVAQKQSNELGIYDMSGNVWEWCYDKYSRDYYTVSPKENPINFNSTHHVIRGGGWDSCAESCRVAARSYSWHWARNDIGFRLARTRK